MRAKQWHKQMSDRPSNCHIQSTAKVQPNASSCIKIIVLTLIYRYHPMFYLFANLVRIRMFIYSSKSIRIYSRPIKLGSQMFGRVWECGSREWAGTHFGSDGNRRVGVTRISEDGRSRFNNCGPSRLSPSARGGRAPRPPRHRSP